MAEAAPQPSPVTAPPPPALPAWAQEMREIFRGGTVSQYLLHGNVFDLVAYRPPEGPAQYMSLVDFLANVMFSNFDVVLHFNRGTGLRALRGKEEFQKFLKLLDDWNRTSYQGTLPRQPGEALELLDRFLTYSRQRVVIEDGVPFLRPLKTAVVLDFAQFLLPAGEAYAVSDRSAEHLIRVLNWASDPAILGSTIATVLIAENAGDLSRSLLDCPYNARIRVNLPTEPECLDYLDHLCSLFPALASSEVPLPTMAGRLVGLTRVNIQNLVSLATKNDRPLTAKYLARLKKELIEKECYGLLEFMEPTSTLDHVAGHDEARRWLREDAELMRRGLHRSLPMGYLLTGRVGTGKTWLAMCWAGEAGIPCVAFKNFRDKWQGATEGNLEKIFNVLHALGQVLVFVDEADQMTGKRGGGDGDSGVSGRVYALLAKEMSDTRNRGRILWIFATSRPDLVEVDLKRPGRLDVHIPLFPPQTDEQRQALFSSMASKVGLPLPSDQLPSLPSGVEIGGNEMEALLVRAMRRHDLADPADARPLQDDIADCIAEYRPFAYVRNLEYMDLIAVKECTDDRFLPERFRSIAPDTLEARLATLQATLGL